MSDDIMAIARRIIKITDRGQPKRMCHACRNWNHWHWPDGTCQDARCECKWRPKGPADLPQYGYCSG